jgi:hypothetical protein
MINIVHATLRRIRVAETRNSRTALVQETTHVQWHVQLEPRFNARLSAADDPHARGEEENGGFRARSCCKGRDKVVSQCATGTQAYGAITFANHLYRIRRIGLRKGRAIQ